MKKSELLRALQTEIQRHSFNTFPDGKAPSSSLYARLSARLESREAIAKLRHAMILAGRTRHWFP